MVSSSLAWEIKEFSRVDLCCNLSYLIMLLPTLSDLKQNKLLFVLYKKGEEI